MTKADAEFQTGVRVTFHGGWVSGVIFDASGSYGAAFLSGLAWNALNITIMAALLIRARWRPELA
jgi:hypothetical protein